MTQHSSAWSRIKSLAPAVLIFLIIMVTLLLMIRTIREANDGHLTYPIDDPYIHLAMSKSLAEEGVWGITPHRFTFSSSSPLWTALLAGVFLIQGVSELAPLIMTTIAGLFTLVLAGILLQRSGLQSWESFIVLGLMTLVSAFPVMILLGMEHVLQIALALWFVWSVSGLLSRQTPSQKQLSAPFFGVVALAAAGVATRYEGAFLVAAACLLFAIRGAWLRGLVLAVGGAVPVVVMGALAMYNGWYPVPNSVLLKKATMDTGSLQAIVKTVGKSVYQLSKNPHVLIILLALVILLILVRRMKTPSFSRAEGAIWITGISFILHLQFAQLGWMYRYEAYLLALAVFVAGLSWGHLKRDLSGSFFLRGNWMQSGLIILAALLILVPLARRSFAAMKEAPLGSIQEYHQQYQMGLFLAKYFPGARIATHDIGAMIYLSQADCLDLVGLANMGTAKLKMQGRWNTAGIDSLAEDHGAILAIVGNNWFNADYNNDRTGGLPRHWVKCEEWLYPGGNWGFPWSFYAIDSSVADSLRAALSDFGPSLPAGVVRTPYPAAGGDHLPPGHSPADGTTDF